MKLKYLLIVPFFMLILTVLSFGIADLFAVNAIEYEREWSREDAVKDQKDWDAAAASLKIAMLLNPYNPSYTEAMGRLYIWRYYIDNNPVKSIDEVQDILDEGLRYVQRSIELRPVWPSVRVTLRELKAAAEETGLELVSDSK
ncbi:MAG: hypothetical protein ACI9D5_000312 [Candidatus Endobugula sp.]|jgi:hypothetical protein